MFSESPVQKTFSKYTFGINLKVMRHLLLKLSHSQTWKGAHGGSPSSNHLFNKLWHKVTLFWSIRLIIYIINKIYQLNCITIEMCQIYIVNIYIFFIYLKEMYKIKSLLFFLFSFHRPVTLSHWPGIVRLQTELS